MKEALNKTNKKLRVFLFILVVDLKKKYIYIYIKKKKLYYSFIQDFK